MKGHVREAVASMLDQAKRDLAAVSGAAATMVGLAEGAPHIAATALLESLDKAQALLAVLEEAWAAQCLAQAEAQEPPPSESPAKAKHPNLEALRAKAFERAMETHRADYFNIYASVFLELDREVRARGVGRRGRY